jgi:formate dehydrogenase gamma subunit
VKRFTPIERFAHRSISILMFILLATAAALYIPDISVLVGNRGIVKTIHSISGFLLPIPLLIAVFFPVFRMNIRELNRFHPHDFAWLKRRDSKLIDPELEHPDSVYGKFNAGQKLNAAFSLGSVLIMFATGMIMFFSSLFTDDVRTGATFVHDWLTLAIVVALTGHIYMATKDAQARAGMRSGEVTRSWAAVHHPQWEHVTHRSGASEPEIHPVDKN